MQLSEAVKPISYLKTKTADVINSVNEKRQPIIITQNGNLIPQDEMFEKLEKKLFE